MPRIRQLSLFCLCCAAVLSLFPRVTAAADDHLQYPPPQVSRDWIASALDKDQLTYLDGEKMFFALFAEEQLGHPKGAVLIIPDPKEIPWPDSLLELHKELSQHGWHSLIISMPEQGVSSGNDTDNGGKPTDTPAPGDKSPAPTTSETGQSAEEPAMNTDPYAGAMQQRLDAAIAFLQTKGQFNIVIAASGSSGEYADQLLEKHLVASHQAGVNPIQAVVLINAKRKGSAEWLKALAALPLPVLDIYNGNDSADRAAEKRRGIFKRQRQFPYVQVALPKPMPEERNLTSRLARRCRGWLDQHITGMKPQKLIKVQ